jgi:hypothetical protein
MREELFYGTFALIHFIEDHHHFYYYYYYIETICAHIVAFKPDIVITEKGVSDLAQHYFVKVFYTYMYTCIYIYSYIHMRIYVYLLIYVCIYVYIYCDRREGCLRPSSTLFRQGKHHDIIY